MKEHTIEQQTFEYYQSGFNCAEALTKSVIEAFSKEAGPDIPKVASAFCGGVGATKEELCGALSAGILVIGFFTGRTHPTENLQDAKTLASDLRNQFIEQYGATKCQTILEQLGPQENKMKCKKLTANVSGMVSRLLLEKGFCPVDKGDEKTM